MPSGVGSPASSASCQPFLRSTGLSSPRTYAKARRRGSARANRRPTRACNASSPSAQSATVATAADGRSAPCLPMTPPHYLGTVIGYHYNYGCSTSTSFWCEIGPFGGRIKCHPDPPAGGPGTMIIDRYAPVNLFEIVPQRAMAFEPELRELDRLLEDDGLFERVKADFSRRRPQSRTRGRHSTPVEVLLRMLVVKRLYRWSYEQTEHLVGDSLVLRQFCRLYWEPVPDDTTLVRWAQLIGPQTLEQLNARVVELAHSLQVTRGRKLRVDSTVIATPIHHPTDSRLLGDGVRVLSRLLRRAKRIVGEQPGLSRQAFRTRTRSVRRLAQQVHRLARRKGEEAAEQLKAAYTRLVGIAQQSC